MATDPTATIDELRKVRRQLERGQVHIDGAIDRLTRPSGPRWRAARKRHDAADAKIANAAAFSARAREAAEYGDKAPDFEHTEDLDFVSTAGVPNAEREMVPGAGTWRRFDIDLDILFPPHPDDPERVYFYPPSSASHNGLWLAVNAKNADRIEYLNVQGPRLEGETGSVQNRCFVGHGLGRPQHGEPGFKTLKASTRFVPLPDRWYRFRWLYKLEDLEGELRIYDLEDSDETPIATAVQAWQLEGDPQLVNPDRLELGEGDTLAAIFGNGDEQHEPVSRGWRWGRFSVQGWRR